MQDAGAQQQPDSEGARWYLSRDGQQHGPLSDRELSLFAEGGNFQPNDLLWTAGLDEWKSAVEIFGLASDEPASAEPAIAEPAIAEPELEDTDFLPDVAGTAAPDASAEVGEPSSTAESSPSVAEAAAPQGEAGAADDPLLDDQIDGDHVGALAKALSGEAEPKKLSFQERLAADFQSSAGLFGYLWATFVVLTIHAVIGGAQYGVGLSFFVLTTINAFLVMRAMPFLDRIAFFQNLAHKPLVYSIVYKTMAFVTGLVLVYAVEMGILGLLGIGSGVMSLGGSVPGMLGWWLIFCVALLPYFAFREVEGAIGADMMGKLLLGKL